MDQDLSKLKIDKTGMTGLRAGRSRRRIWFGIIMLLFAAAAVALLIRDRAAEVETVMVSKAYPSQAFTLLNASGYVVAQRKAAVASKATGRLEWLGVEEGSRVKAGQIIARLEGKDAAAARDQAAANLNNAIALLEQARADLDDAALNEVRMRDLMSKGYVAKVDLDTAEARLKKSKASYSASEAAVKAARASLDAADVAVEYTVIRAPFDAVVLTKNADVGDIVTPLGAAANAKAAVVTTADLSSLLVEVDVSESNIEKVRIGGPCEIQLDALPETRFKGVVHMIVPTADRARASVLVKVRFEETDGRIMPEMSAKVAFLERSALPEEKTAKTVVHPEAITTRNGGSFVFLDKDGRAVERSVTTGSRILDLVEIGGVEAGSKVVLRPPKGLKNGSKIKIKEKS